MDGALEGGCEVGICQRPLAVKSSKLLSPATVTGNLRVPCGSCENCTVNKKRILQNRLILESAVHDNSCHVGLTYNDECLPSPPFIDVRTAQLFIKSLRNEIKKDDPYRRIKYYVCGEYGFGGGRPWNPHYHVILYNVNPIEDYEKILLAWCDKETRKLRCDLEQLKPTELTPELAAYCCGYVAKKAKDENNRWLDDNYRFMYRNFPKKNLPFANWSNGLGLDALNKIKASVKKHKNVTAAGVRTNQKQYPLGRYLKEKLDSGSVARLESGMYFNNYIPLTKKLLNLAVGQLKFQKQLEKTRKGVPVKHMNDDRRWL